MTEYKGHHVTVAVSFLLDGGITEASYAIARGGVVIHKNTVRGPFATRDEADSTAGASARQWIDQRSAE